MSESRISIHQSQFIKKIDAYLKGRERELVFKFRGEGGTIEGLCNGAALTLLEKMFYDCINRHYQTQVPIKELLEKTIASFFSDIDAIIATDDAELNSPEHQMKLSNRKHPDYLAAKNKLENAIHLRLLQVPSTIITTHQSQYQHYYIEAADSVFTKDRPIPSDYFLTLIDLAGGQNILSKEEVELLKQEHIPDLPLFEKFISQVFLLQTDKTIFLHDQADLIGKFEQLTIDQQDKPLPLPILEHSQFFMGTPEDLIVRLDDIFPDERLIYIEFPLPKHVVAAFRINGEYFYYEPNNDSKNLIYCKTSILFILKLSLSVLKLAYSYYGQMDLLKRIAAPKSYGEYMASLSIENVKTKAGFFEHLEKSRQWLESHPEALLFQMNGLQQEIENIEAGGKIVMAWALLPSVLRFDWQVYRHPSSPPHHYQAYPILPNSKSDVIQKKLQQIDFSGETILFRFARNGDLDSLNIYLESLGKLTEIEKGKILNHRNKKGLSALQCAVSYTNVSIVDALLLAGATPNTADLNGDTPLFLACQRRNIKIFKLLLAHGANPNQKLKNSSLLGAIIADEMTHNFFDALLPYADPSSKIEEWPSIFICIQKKYHDCLEKLLKRGANPMIGISETIANTMKIVGSCTALRYAVMVRNIDAVVLLLRFGATIGRFNLPRVERDVPDKSFFLLLSFPFMAKGETKSQQIQLLFQHLALPGFFSDLFPTAERFYKTYAGKISSELQKPENINLNEQGIRAIIEKIINEIPGGRSNLSEGDFKRRIDWVLDHYLGAALDTTPQNSAVVTRESTRAMQAKK